MSPERPDRLTLLAFSTTILLGGANFVAVRFSNRELPPFWGASLRFAVASLLFFALVAALRLALPRRRALLGAVLYGTLTFGGTYALLYWGLVQVPAGLASLIMASGPLLTLLFAVAHRLEPFRLRGLLGALLALAGIGLMFAGPAQTNIPLLSLLAVLAGAACAAEASVLVKMLPGAHPITTNALGMASGALVLLAFSLLAGEARALPTEPDTWMALAYLVLLGSVGLFALFLFVIRRWTASATAYAFVLFPLVAVVLSALLEGEPVTLGLLAGGALVPAGVYLGALKTATLSHPKSRRESRSRR